MKTEKFKNYWILRRSKSKLKLNNRFFELMNSTDKIITQTSIKRDLKLHNDKARELFEEHKDEIINHNIKNVDNTSNSKIKIREFLESYQGSVKITQQLIADKTNLSLSTIKQKITKEQKAFIKNYNLKLKK